MATVCRLGEGREKESKRRSTTGSGTEEREERVKRGGRESVSVLTVVQFMAASSLRFASTQSTPVFLFFSSLILTRSLSPRLSWCCFARERMGHQLARLPACQAKGVQKGAGQLVRKRARTIQAGCGRPLGAVGCAGCLSDWLALSLSLTCCLCLTGTS